MRTVILSLFICTLSILSCKKDNIPGTGSLYHTWEAKTFMSIESVAYPKTEGKKVLLTFNPSGNVGLNLDVNGCGSSFVISKPGQIKMEPFLCTEVCCDSKFSDKLLSMLPQVTSYETVKNTLRLNVPRWGYIELEMAD